VASTVAALKAALNKTAVVSKAHEIADKEKTDNFSKLIIWKEIPNHDIFAPKVSMALILMPCMICFRQQRFPQPKKRI